MKKMQNPSATSTTNLKNSMWGKNEDGDQKKFALIPKGSQTVWIDDGDKLHLYDGVTPRQ